MLFVSCGGSSATGGDSGKKFDASDLTYTKVVDMLTQSEALDVSAAEKLDYGSIVAAENDLILFVKTEADAKANLTVTTTVYNLNLGKVVLTDKSTVSAENVIYLSDDIPVLVNTPAIDICNLTDEYRFYTNVITLASVTRYEFPKSEYDAEIKALREFYGIDPKIPESMIAGNPNAGLYFNAVSAIPKYLYCVSYDMYDTTGKKIDTVKYDRLTEDMIINGVDEDYTYAPLSEKLGVTAFVAPFNENTVDIECLMPDLTISIGIFPAIGFKIKDKVYNFSAFSYSENGDFSYNYTGTSSYGQVYIPAPYQAGDFGIYVIDTSSGTPDELAIVNRVSGEHIADLSLYDIADGLAKDSSYRGSYEANINALSNGKFLVSLTLRYDYGTSGYDYMEGGYYYDVIYLLLNPANGYYKEVLADADYVIEHLVPLSYYAMIDTFNIDPALAKNVDMIGISKIESDAMGNKVLGDDLTCFIDGDLNIVFSTDGALIPEQDPNSMPRRIANGNYLVDLLPFAPAEKAIVTADGTVRAYLSDDAIVAGEFVLTYRGIYDYDLNLLYDFEENDSTLYYPGEIFGKFYIYWKDVASIEFQENPDKNDNGIPDDEEYIHPSDDMNGNGVYDWEEEDYYKPSEEILDLWNDDSGVYTLEYKDGKFVMERFDPYAKENGDYYEDDNYDEYNPYVFQPYYFEYGKIDTVTDTYVIVDDSSTDSETGETTHFYILYNSSLTAVIASQDDIIIRRYGDFLYAAVYNDIDGFTVYALNGASSK